MDLQRRKARLIELLDRLRSGSDVAPRDLNLVLTDQQFGDLQQQWQAQKELRGQAREKPAAIVEYEKRLQRALFEYGKAEGYAGSTRRAQPVGSDGKRASTRGYRRAETAFEQLLEYLDERLSADPSLCMWLDRQVDFGPTGGLGLGPAQMPRVVTSRSADRKGNGWLVGLQTKRDVKRAALEEALAATVAEEELAERVAARIAEERLKEEQARAEQVQTNLQSLRKWRRT